MATSFWNARAALLAFGETRSFRDFDSLCLIDTGIVRQIIDGSAERCHRIQSQFLLQSSCKDLGHFIIAVGDKYFFRFFF